jgi:putative molybdopterin biosynthesis protein
VLFINRQQGAGTRILLDTELERIGIRGAHVRGYDREESSHSSIAAAVAGGDADTGLGIRAAAHALDLDFIPLSHERYDLVIPVERYESDLLQPLLSFLRDPDEEFLGRVKALGGYEVSNMGKVLAEI